MWGALAVAFAVGVVVGAWLAVGWVLVAYRELADEAAGEALE